RETESLDAFRAVTEGWLRLETLAVDELHGAAAEFERAVGLDHRYALAFTGLANAKFALYETTRSDNEPALHLLRESIEHARHARRSRTIPVLRLPTFKWPWYTWLAATSIRPTRSFAKGRRFRIDRRSGANDIPRLACIGCALSSAWPQTTSKARWPNSIGN